MNHEYYQKNVDSIPETTFSYDYTGDTVRITKLDKKGDLEIQEMIFISEDTAMPTHSHSKDYSRTHNYVNDLSLVETRYVRCDISNFEVRDSSVIVYQFELDDYGNWLKRKDNGIESYSREYEYDKHGNWVRMIEFEKELKVKEVHRAYTYAED